MLCDRVWGWVHRDRPRGEKMGLFGSKFLGVKFFSVVERTGTVQYIFGPCDVLVPSRGRKEAGVLRLSPARHRTCHFRSLLSETFLKNRWSSALSVERPDGIARQQVV